MPQCLITRVRGKLGVYSWTTGFKHQALSKPKTEDDILCACLRLERLGQAEAADQLLEEYFRCRERRATNKPSPTAGV